MGLDSGESLVMVLWVFIQVTVGDNIAGVHSSTTSEYGLPAFQPFGMAW